MGRFVAEEIQIASVYPMAPAPVGRPFGPTKKGGYTTYTITPCPKGSKPTLLTVADAWQATKDPFTRKDAAPDLITVDQIAKDILQEWTAPRLLGVPPGLGPGIWICAGEQPTEAEIQAALARQTSYFEWLFYDGQKQHQDGKWNAIGEEHRIAAAWLGKDEPWVRKLTHEDTLKCPACRTVVDAQAYICANCHFPVKPMPADMLEQLAAAQAPTVNRRASR